MQKRSPACKLLLLITPALFVLLQVALAQHHHRNNSYHDGHDFFQAVSTSVDKHFSTAIDLINFLPHTWCYNTLVAAAYCSFHNYRETDLFISPSQSRAPPVAINSRAA